MTKEVMVTLSGLQLGDSGEDTVETVHIGEYYEKNGVHYLFFDELLEGHKTPIRNMLKLRNEKLEVRKRGPVSAELVFEEGEVTESAYKHSVWKFSGRCTYEGSLSGCGRRED